MGCGQKNSSSTKAFESYQSRLICLPSWTLVSVMLKGRLIPWQILVYTWTSSSHCHGQRWLASCSYFGAFICILFSMLYQNRASFLLLSPWKLINMQVIIFWNEGSRKWPIEQMRPTPYISFWFFKYKKKKYHLPLVRKTNWCHAQNGLFKVNHDLLRMVAGKVLREELLTQHNSTRALFCSPSISNGATLCVAFNNTVPYGW